MKTKVSSTVIFLVSVFVILSCQKEIEPYDPGTIGGNPGGGTNGGNTPSNCNNIVQKLKSMQAIHNSELYIRLGWKADGNIDSIRYNVPISDYRTARFIYVNGRISSAILYENLYSNGAIADTAVFHYNNAGKVDSMYLKQDDRMSKSFTYDATGKLIRVTRYDGVRDTMYYSNIQMDANGNVTKSVEWWKEISGYSKVATYTYTRDTKKNPFAALAPYMFFLDDDSDIFRYWGPNNYTDERGEIGGFDLTTGNKFAYNNNCYPIASQNTLMGIPLFPEPDFEYTYH